MSGFALLPAARTFAAALAICLLCAPAHSQSAINTTNLVGVPLSKPIRSMKDLRYASIVSQQFDYSCGAAALGTLLRYGHRVDIPDTELIRTRATFLQPGVVVKNGFALPGQSFVESGLDNAVLF